VSMAVSVSVSVPLSHKQQKQEKQKEQTNQENTGWTSVDRSTKATLSTYNTWIQLSRLQKIYHFQSPKFLFATIAFNSSCG
jgi:hypothetical protein